MAVKVKLEQYKIDGYREWVVREVTNSLHPVVGATLGERDVEALIARSKGGGKWTVTITEAKK
jgi:hypothetical protein